MKKFYTTNSEQETQRIAADFVKTLKGGEVILLSGELGAGKTTFVQGIAKAFGIKQITSPTFVLMQIYKTKHKKVKQLCHMDLYRIECSREFEPSGLDEYLYMNDTVCFIEWGEKIKDILRDYIQIKMKIAGPKKRTIDIEKHT